MFRERYSRMNERISPEPELIKNIINSDNKQAEQIHKRKKLQRPVIVMGAFIICLFTAMPALAANVTSIYELMYLVSPSVAQSFLPVQKSCVSNGIEMEVISTYIHGKTAEIYITMKDLEGNRIDETIDLNDSYNLRIPFDSIAHCERIGYDKKTKTATFLISITNCENKEIDGDKLTFSVNEFLSHKKEYKDLLVRDNLSDVEEAIQTQKVELRGWSGKSSEAYIADSENVIVLTPSKPMKFPVQGIELTGMGYLGGRLHVQTSVVNNLSKDNHGYFVLKDEKGNVVDSDYSVAFSNDSDKGELVDYDEYVFNIPRTEIHNYALYGDFVTSGMFTEGKWKVTFNLEKSEDHN